MTATVVVRKPAVGDAYWVLGGLYEVKVSSEESDGELVAMQMTIPEGMGPPPHTHTGAEAVYVLEGSVRYHIGDETADAGAGSFFYIPAGTWEHFEPLGGTVRLFVEYMPGGDMDKFFAEVGEPAQRREVPSASEAPPDMDRLISASPRYGLNMRTPEET